MEWYVRSAGRAEAHYGLLDDDGTATARCGVQFQPQQPFGDGPLSPHAPVDPRRCCPQMPDRKNSEQGADGAEVAGMIDALGSWRGTSDDNR
jgi:hypothetical protein